MTDDTHRDALEAYAFAQERCQVLRDEWVRLGKPAMSDGSKGQPVPHPLLKAMHEADVIADRLRERLRVKHRGPQTSAVMQAGVGRSPSSSLRVAK